MIRSRSAIPYWVLLVLSLAWVVMIFYPVMDGLDGSLSGISALLYVFFKPVCHQQMDRCLWIAGTSLPVCARCLGIYLGGVLGLFMWGLVRGTDDVRVPARYWLVLGFLPVAVDGVINATGLLTSPAAVRMITGLIAGATVACILAPGCASLLVHRADMKLKLIGARE